MRRRVSERRWRLAARHERSPIRPRTGGASAGGRTRRPVGRAIPSRRTLASAPTTVSGKKARALTQPATKRRGPAACRRISSDSASDTPGPFVDRQAAGDRLRGIEDAESNCGPGGPTAARRPAATARPAGPRHRAGRRRRGRRARPAAREERLRLVPRESPARSSSSSAPIDSSITSANAARSISSRSPDSSKSRTRNRSPERAAKVRRARRRSPRSIQQRSACAGEAASTSLASTRSARDQLVDPSAERRRSSSVRNRW